MQSTVIVACIWHWCSAQHRFIGRSDFLISFKFNSPPRVHLSNERSVFVNTDTSRAMCTLFSISSYPSYRFVRFYAAEFFLMPLVGIRPYCTILIYMNTMVEINQTFYRNLDTDKFFRRLSHTWPGDLDWFSVDPYDRRKKYYKHLFKKKKKNL